MALAHAVDIRFETAYRRGDRLNKWRRQAVAWSHFCAVPAAAGEVVPSRRGTP